MHRNLCREVTNVSHNLHNVAHAVLSRWIGKKIGLHFDFDA
ncbi:hypothetical protein [Streptomonospora alba]|nr:hypothetical protein [Streptomonospora alba]